MLLPPRALQSPALTSSHSATLPERLVTQQRIVGGATSAQVVAVHTCRSP
jgi:hypothetical protein